MRADRYTHTHTHTLYALYRCPSLSFSLSVLCIQVAIVQAQFAIAQSAVKLITRWCVSNCTHCAVSAPQQVNKWTNEPASCSCSRPVAHPVSVCVRHPVLRSELCQFPLHTQLTAAASLSFSVCVCVAPAQVINYNWLQQPPMHTHTHTRRGDNCRPITHSGATERSSAIKFKVFSTGFALKLVWESKEN